MCVIRSHILTPSGERVRLQPVSMKPKKTGGGKKTDQMIRAE